MLYSLKGIIPNDYWIHDVNMKDKNGNNIIKNLLVNNYIY